jgi:XRE family aerobic/anaerobic benzoate catabolism transcriptional regulator
MAASRSKSRPRQAAKHDDFVAGIGALVRRGRARRGMTRRQLAAQSGASERYLAQIESGEGNPSIVVLNAIAAALDVPVAELLPGGGGHDPALERIVDLLRHVPAPELPAVAALIEGRTAGAPADERDRRIALIGLRGAGKSTLGRRLAAHLRCPFIELDRVIAQDYGASIPDLFEMGGLATFRRYERACLERVIAAHERAVIATAGGIVSSPETYALLLRHTHTIWLRARPQEHMSRVMAQGDLRPMAKNPAAMADLVAILEARRTDYVRAEAELDTAGDDVEKSLTKLVRIAQQCLEGARPPGAAPGRGGKARPRP